MSLIKNIVPTEVELKSYQIIATVAANNAHWRKLGGSGKPEEVVATILSVMLLARELGISPMMAVSGGINNIQGKFEISARLMNQLIRQQGHQLAIKGSSDIFCSIWAKRKDTGEELTETFLIEDASRAGLIKGDGGWKKWPKDMLFARCISRLARRLFPDCIGGCYVEGEISDTLTKEPSKPLDLPGINEIEMDIIPPANIELNLPEGLIKERVDMFLEVCSKNNKGMAINDVKIRAQSNMEEFLKHFYVWEGCAFPPEMIPLTDNDENFTME